LHTNICIWTAVVHLLFGYSSLPLLVDIISFSGVLHAVILMGSGESCHKAFTTCFFPMPVVGLYYSPAMFM
jgi:olfactory receptor